MNSNKNIYGVRSSGGNVGDVFTSPAVVCYMLDKVGYTPDRDLSGIKILEPSCGEGEFVIEIAKRIMTSSEIYNFNAGKVFIQNVQAFDIDADKVEICRTRVKSLGIEQVENIFHSDFLKANACQADIVVGNPPYIRYEYIPKEMIGYCKEHFHTFHYRSDLYVPFFEKTLSLLNNGGIHCFICSNRWLKNEYGKKLRTFISREYQLQLIVNLEQANAFQENVLAYPAITVIAAKPPQEVFEYAECTDINRLHNLQTIIKPMPDGADWTKAFVEKTACTFLMSIEEQGFKIGIGVATGADAVFISDTLPDKVERDLILPAINARNLRGDKLRWDGKYLLNPYKVNGDLINLEQYPKAKSYLESHRDKLASRHITSKTPAQWYRTIDRITPSVLSQPKILLPDMSGNNFIFVDDGNYYPLHNIYYITGHTARELRILAAQLMSDFVRRQLKSVTNQMNGGFPRWQSQHLRKLQIIDISSIPDEEAQLLLDYYDKKNINGINALISELLQESREWNVPEERSTPVELTLQFAF